MMSCSHCMLPLFVLSLFCSVLFTRSVLVSVGICLIVFAFCIFKYRVRQWKTVPLKNVCISGKVARIWAKLSEFIYDPYTTYSANFIEETDMINRYSTLIFKVTFLKSDYAVVHWIYPWRTSQTLHQQFRSFSDECQLLIAHSVFKQCSDYPPVQQHTIIVCCKMIWLPQYQWTLAANHSILSTKVLAHLTNVG